jgi:CRP-like cAMP-binding protein
MLRKDAKIELLKKVPLFSQCSKKELGAIASLTDLVDMPEGARLVTEGELGREFMVIVDGEARVDRGGRKVNTLGPGDFFGEIALISGGPRLASVKLTKPSRLLVMTVGPFRGLLDDMPSIQVKVLQALAERLRPLAV